MAKLSELQQRVFDVLDARPNTDIPLDSLYEAAYGEIQPELFEAWTNRRVQQKMGPLFARINKKLKRGRIEPGLVKRTYRLNTKLDV